MRIWAGTSAAVSGFDSEPPSVSTSIRLEGEPRVMDGEGRVQVPAHAAQGEAALGVGHHRPGPRRKVIEQVVPQ